MYPKVLKEYKQFYFYEKYEFFGGEDKLVDIYLHKNYDIGMHCHDFYEINIVLSGKGCHYIGSKAIPVSGGEVFVIPPDVSHGYYRDGELDVYHILLKNNFMEKYKNDLNKIPFFSTLFEIEPYLRQVYNTFIHLKLTKNDLYDLSGQIDKMIILSSNKYEICKTIFVLGLLNTFCILMERQSEDNAAKSEDKDILAVLQYIQAHYNEKISIDDLMHISNMSRPTFHRHFKKVTQMTPMEYIISTRVAAARNQLAGMGKSRTEIAHNLGFYDTSHMNKHLHGIKK